MTLFLRTFSSKYWRQDHIKLSDDLWQKIKVHILLELN